MNTLIKSVMRYFFLFSNLLLCIITALGQQPQLPRVIPPTPEAAAFARYGEIPVSAGTGVPNIGVDLYLLQSGKLQVPIRLSYHAAGQRVNDYGSTVGLGWVVNSHGVISRTTFGIADEEVSYRPYRSSADITNFINGAVTPLAKAGACSDLSLLYNGSYDTQSDRYSYNFPNHSGIFRYDFKTDLLMTVPYAPLKIERKKDNPQDLVPYFEITAEDGTRYLFQDIESSLALNTHVNRSWYLSKIISSDNVDQISFTYMAGASYQESNYSQMIHDGDMLSQCNQVGGQINSYELKTTNNYVSHFPIYISAIDSRTTRVTFEYVNDRLDKIKNRLGSISIFDKLSPASPVRKIDFKQSYFGTAADKNLRLKLEAVSISGKGLAKEEVYTFTYNNKVLPPFQGDDANFPMINFHEDYWGYWNGTSGTLIPKEFIAAQIATTAQQSGHEGNRNPNPLYMDACMIQSVQYPLKGRTEFEFEPNIAGPDYYPYANNNNGIVGGLRVKSIKSYADDNSSPIVKTYEYPAAGVNQQLAREFFTYNLPYTFKLFDLTQIFVYNCCQRPHYYTTSSPSGTLTENNGSPVIYTKVIEYSGTLSDNIGKKEYYYDFEPVQYNYDLPGPRFTGTFHYDRGFSEPRLTSEKVYRRENGQYKIVTSTDYLYDFLKPHEFNTGFKLDRITNYTTNLSDHPLPVYCEPDQYLSEFIYSDTKGYEDVPVLVGKDEYTYVTDTEYLRAHTSYYYENLVHLNKTREIFTASDGKVFTTQYKYPSDFVSGSNIYKKMIDDKHILNPIIEQVRLRGDIFLESSKTNYKDWGSDMIAPETIETRGGDGIAETRIRFSGYDAYGNILSVSKENDLNTSYIWGYKYSHPVAKIVGTSYDVAYNILTTAQKDALVNPTSDQQVRDIIQVIRSHPSMSNAMIYTYTYEPLVGLKSSVDENDRVTTYEYDSLNRLKLIRDDHNNIVKTYEYHFQIR